MTELITLFLLLIGLYSSNPACTDTGMAKDILAEYQIAGYESAVDKIAAYSESMDPSAGNGDLQGTKEDDIPDDTNENEQEAGNIFPAPETEPPENKIIPAKLDYQKELLSLGFYREDSKDGKLNLRNAVLRFQSSCNLTVDGKWNDKCRKALVEILSAESAAPLDSIASPPTEGIWIAVNKTKRTLTLYEGSNILKKYPVAIGNPSSLTPEGKFTIVSKVIDPDWGGGGYAKPVKGGLPSNPLGHRWIGLSYKTGDDLGIHGNNSPYSIGKNISHGCIRMINSDVEELFEVIPKSAIVWIGTVPELTEWGLVQKEQDLQQGS